MRVFLTGFMGAGKTTVGRRLSERLLLPFLDLDEWVEEGEGESIPEIFERVGESEFRRLEHEALRRLCDLPEMVVATGGGTATCEGNRDLMRSSGVTVWLAPEFDTIARRIGIEGKRDRPMFADESQALALYRRRLSAYGRCDLRVEIGAEERASEVAARIDLLLRDYA